MGQGRRWDPCVVHRDDEVDGFIDDYFAKQDRNVLFVAGAGFDPRSCAVANRLKKNAIASMRALLIQEERPNPPEDQSARAKANADKLLEMIVDQKVVPIEIFGPDNAVVGGRNVIKILHKQSLEGVTDVIVDISALSAGVSFPIVRYFFECIDLQKRALNLHIFVDHAPHLDAGVRSLASDAPLYVHGFKGRSTLSDMADVAKLWLPQLAAGRNFALGKIYDFVGPHDTCPILPFPASNPRISDELTEEYLTELESTWSVDTRNIIYADEEDPLDLYRTILRLDDLRKRVFSETEGSMLILSPLGSKLMALGALMAALERNLPVAYLESVGYQLHGPVMDEIGHSNLIHLWLEGDVYPQPRSVLQM